MRYPHHFYTVIDTHATAMTNMIYHDMFKRDFCVPRVIPKFAYDYTLATGKIIDIEA